MIGGKTDRPLTTKYAAKMAGKGGKKMLKESLNKTAEATEVPFQFLLQTSIPPNFAVAHNIGIETITYEGQKSSSDDD